MGSLLPAETKLLPPLGSGFPPQKYDMGAEPRAGDRRLHLNEFRFEHHPSVRHAARIEERQLVEYSRGATTGLLRALEAYVGLPAEHYFVAAGSDEALRGIALYCARRGMAYAIGGVPTYTHFVIYAKQAGLEWTPVMMGLGSTQEDRKALMELYVDKLKRGALVYLVSPNNPTGATWPRETVADWATKFPKSVFLVDEAYIEFVRGEETRTSDQPQITDLNLSTCSLAGLAQRFPNVIVTRTFSKAFGLAGMRIGYGIACPPLVEQLMAYVSPKSVTSAAMACAEACLQRGVVDWYARTTAQAVVEREKMRAGLKERGWRVETGGGNFALVWGGRKSGELVERLRARGVHVRDRSELPGLDGYVRVTAGTPEDTKATLEAFGKFKQMPDDVRVQDYHTPTAHIVKLRQMLTRALKVLAAAGVKCWACEGTLLGVVRHGGIPPWDDDNDLGYVCQKGAEDVVEGLVDFFHRENLTLQRNRTGAYWQLGENAPGEIISPQHIDLFPYFLESGFYVNADPRFRAASGGAMCNTTYTPEELFPLGALPFYDGAVPVPARPDVVLDRALGKDWRRRAVVRTPGRPLDYVSFEIRDFSPA